MSRGILSLVLALASALALAADKPKKPPEVNAQDLLQQAQQKEAAGDVAGAIDLLKQAAAHPSATAEPSLRLGKIYEGKGELDLAIDAYAAAGEKATGASKGEALGRLSVVQEERGIGDSAASAEKAAAEDPSGAWPLVALARARARAGKGDEAASLAEKARAAGAGPAADAALGLALEAKGDLPGAEAAYRKALETPPGPLAASVGLGRVLRRTSRPGEALPLLQKAIESAAGAVDAYKESARAKIALHRSGDAVSDAATAAALADADPDAQRLSKEVAVASALDDLRTGQIDRAEGTLTVLKQQDPGFAPALVALARVFMARKQPDAAAAELQKAIELQPDLAEAYFQTGYLNHVVRQNAAKSLEPFRKAVSLDPGNTEYRTSLGAALTDARDFDSASTELHKVTDGPGYNALPGFLYLGAAELGAKRYKAAIPPLEKAVSLAPTSAQAEAYLAWCYFGLKDAEAFKKHASRARELGHKEPTLLQYLSRVEKGEAIK